MKLTSNELFHLRAGIKMLVLFFMLFNAGWVFHAAYQYFQRTELTPAQMKEMYKGF